jgi:hypothetical protein
MSFNGQLSMFFHKIVFYKSYLQLKLENLNPFNILFFPQW